MPVFSTRPELPPDISPGRGVGLLSDHLCRMQEELEYRLSVLDSSNVLSLDLDHTAVHTPQGELKAVLSDGSGKVSALEQTVEGFRTQVADYEGQVSEFRQTAQGFQTQVADYEGQVSQFRQTAQGFQTQVADYQGAVEGYSAQVSQFQQTAQGFRTEVGSLQSDVDGLSGSVSAVQQTAKSLTASVSDLEDGMSAALILNKNGLIVQNGDGEQVSISGSQIEAGSITADKIESITVSADALTGDEIAISRDNGSVVGGLSTFRSGMSLVSNGELGLAAYGGELYIEGPGSTVLSIEQYGPYDEYSFLFNADLLPDGTCWLGRPGWAWASAYLESAPVVSSDARKKQDICYDLGRYDRLFDRLAPASYRLKRQPEEGRHLGFIAQDVRQALADCGMAEEEFAGLVREGDSLSLRYDSFIPLLVQQVHSLKKRVEELERGPAAK